MVQDTSSLQITWEQIARCRDSKRGPRP